jgi:hypothetical protein
VRGLPREARRTVLLTIYDVGPIARYAILEREQKRAKKRRRRA